LTGAASEGFELQLATLKNLHDYEVSCHPSVMALFSSQENIAELGERLQKIDSALPREIEVEELILYPHVTKRLKKLGFDLGAGHDPCNVPEKLV
jgi:uncharacterized Fe-S cluster-containing radical SAM superfamily protein